MNRLIAGVIGLGLIAGISGCAAIDAYHYRKAKIKETEARADVMDMYRQCLKEKQRDPQTDCSAYGNVLSVSVK